MTVLYAIWVIDTVFFLILRKPISNSFQDPCHIFSILYSFLMKQKFFLFNYSNIQYLITQSNQLDYLNDFILKP